MNEEQIQRLLAAGMIEPSKVDDEEIAALWQKSLGSYQDAQVSRLSGEGAFKLLYDAGRQAAQALVAAHGFRTRGTTGHHQSLFAAAAALSEDPLPSLFGRMDRQRSLRHDIEYAAYGTVDPEELNEMRALVRELVNGTAAALREVRPAVRRRIKKVRS